MKKALSLVLSLLLLFSALPMAVGAVEAEVSEAAAEAEVTENVTETQPLENDLPEPEPEPETVAEKADLADTGAEDDLAETGASYGLWVGSVQVTDANKSDILGDGGKAKFDSATKTLTLNNPTISGAHNDSTIFCNGFDLTVKGSYTMTAAQSCNAVTVFDYGLTLDGNFTFLAWSYAVEASYDINVIGGRVIAKLEDSAYAQNIAFCSDVGILIFGDNVEYFEAEITDTGRTSCAIGYDTSGTVTLSSKLKLSEPEGGRFSDGACVYTEGTKQKWAKKVVIEPANPSDVKYDVWVGSTQVTGANKNNILNDGGKAKYDPSTATLTLNNPTISTAYSDGSYTYKIYAEDDLTVKGSYTMTSYSTDYGIDCYTNLRLDGDFTFLGYRYGVYARLTLTVNGSLTGRMNSTTTTLSNAAGITADTIKFGEITRVEAEGKKVYGIYAARGLTIPPEYEISVPTASYIENGTVVDNSTSQIAKRVVITPVVGGLGVFLGEKQVTEANSADIFGDGKASYDKATKTLTLNYPTIRGAYQDYFDATYVIYSEDDLTITGQYNRIDYSYNFGFYSEGDLTINADIIRIGGTYAIDAGGNLTINGVGSGQLTAWAGKIAIRSEENITIGSGMTYLEAEGEYGAFCAFESLTVSDELTVTVPEGGMIKGGEVLESDGETYAKKAVLKPITAYDLWLGNTRVTEKNKDDIMDDGGSAKFDPATNTLTLDDPTVTGTYAYTNIYSEGFDLTVKGVYQMAESYGQYGIKAETLTLDGEFTFLGKETGIYVNNGMTSSGKLTAKGESGRAVNVRHGNIVINNSTVEVQGGTSGLHAADGSVTFGAKVSSVIAEGGVYGGIYASADITVNGGFFNVTGTDSGGKGAIYSYNGDVTINGGTVRAAAEGSYGIYSRRGNVNLGAEVKKVTADSAESAIFAESGISLDPALTITTPEDGFVIGKVIYDSINITQKYVVIKGPGAVITPDIPDISDDLDPSNNTIVSDYADCRWEFDPDTNVMTVSANRANGIMGDLSSSDRYLSNYKPYYIIIKEGVTHIGKYAFYKWFYIRYVEFPSTLRSIGDHAFENNPQITGIELPPSVTSIGDYAFRYCNNIESVELSENLEVIGKYAFQECYALESVDIPASVTEIPQCAFLSCKKLTEVTLHDGLQKIGSNAFGGCDLRKVTIPDTVTDIDIAAFSGNANLTEVTLGDHLETVGIQAFDKCKSLPGITIPKSVTYIGISAFGFESSFAHDVVQNFTLYVYSGTEGQRYGNALVRDYGKTDGVRCIVLDVPSLGDTDGNCEIEIRDATFIQRNATGIEIPFTINKKTADVDGDGEITVMDATAIQYYLAQMKTPYPIGTVVS